MPLARRRNRCSSSSVALSEANMPRRSGTAFSALPMHWRMPSTLACSAVSQSHACQPSSRRITHTSRDLLSIAALTSSLNVDGHRADLVILKAARAEAAFEGRTKINDHDIALAAELALPHRIKRTPFQQAEMTTEQLQERIEQLAGQSVPSETDDESESKQDGEGEEKKT